MPLRSIDARADALSWNRTRHEHDASAVSREHPAAGDGPFDLQIEQRHGSIVGKP